MPRSARIASTRSLGTVASVPVARANSSAPNAISVPIVDVFAYLRQADLVKMDIEGSEWPILADARLGELDALVIVLEYHRDACPYPDAREAAVRFLADGGFTTYETDAPHRPDGTGVLWGWK